MKKGFLIIFVIFCLILLSNSFVVTYPNEYKMIKQFGEIIRVEKEPGISFKAPLIQSTTTLPNNIQIYDIPISDVITRDKKTMIADAFVLWRISDPIKFTRHLNGQIPQAQSRISASVFSSMKSVISNMDQMSIIENRNGKLDKDIKDNTGTSLSEYGIELLTVETKALDMPSANKQAVYERMISERNNIAASYTAKGNAEAQKIKNNTAKEVNVMKSEANKNAEAIKAEGEAEYMRILSEAYNDSNKAEFYNFVRSLDAAKKSLNGNNKTLVLDKSSPLVQIFYEY